MLAALCAGLCAGLCAQEPKVWGRTREIVKSDVDIDARVLCDGTEFSNESDTFKNGDEFYLYFRTPADGYLSVYLMEDDKDMQLKDFVVSIESR